MYSEKQKQKEREEAWAKLERLASDNAVKLSKALPIPIKTPIRLPEPASPDSPPPEVEETANGDGEEDEAMDTQKDMVYRSQKDDCDLYFVGKL